jgi:toxin ParE1/3/4
MSAAHRSSVVISARAADEIRIAADWYRGERSGLDLQFLESVDATLAQIQVRPRSFVLISAGVRRALLRQFPYGIFFADAGRSAIILAVLHNHRHPRTWPSRPTR